MTWEPAAFKAADIVLDRATGRVLQPSSYFNGNLCWWELGPVAEVEESPADGILLARRVSHRLLPVVNLDGELYSLRDVR